MLENPDPYRRILRDQVPQVGNGELGRGSGIPEQASADLTLRRIQKSDVKPEGPCVWKFVRDGKVLQEGDQNPGEHGLLTIPRVVVEASPGRLQVEAKWIW